MKNREHTNLWNELPFAERERLMPYMIESQILHIEQCKHKAVAAHRAHMKSLNDHIKNLENDLFEYTPF